MKLLNSLVVLIVLGVHSTASCQWKELSLEEYAQVIIDAEKKLNAQQSYSYVLTYNFYEQLEDITPIQSEKMNYWYNAKSKTIYLSQKDKEVFQNSELHLVCDNSLNQMIISDPIPEFITQKSIGDFSKLINGSCTARWKELGNLKIYELNFAKGARFSKCELWLTSESIPTKYIIESSNEIMDDSTDEEKLIQPKMEIIIENFKKGSSVNFDNSKNIDDFLENETTITFLAKYQDYELIDLRKN